MEWLWWGLGIFSLIVIIDWRYSMVTSGAEVLCNHCNLWRPKHLIENGNCDTCRAKFRAFLEKRDQKERVMQVIGMPPKVEEKKEEEVEVRDPIGYMVYERETPGQPTFTPATVGGTITLCPNLITARNEAFQVIASWRGGGESNYDAKDIAILCIYKNASDGTIAWWGSIEEEEIDEAIKEALTEVA